MMRGGRAKYLPYLVTTNASFVTYANGSLPSVDAVRGKVVFCDEYTTEEAQSARHEIARNAPPSVFFLLCVENKSI